MPVIPVVWEAEIRRIAIQGQPRQKVGEPLLPILANKLGLVVHVCNPSYLALGRRITV
jgi:hypothetical protein